MESLKLKKDSFIYIHPMTKIISFFSCSILMMNSGERVVENLLLSFLLLLLLNAKFYKFFMKLFIFSLALVITEFCVFYFSMPILILTIIKFLKMFIPSIISYYLLAKGTTSLELMKALNEFKFPKGITIPVVVMIRFIPTVIEAMKETGKALVIKGFTKKSIIKHPIRSSETILIPVLMSCMNSMDELASASISRGFSLNRKRTYVIRLSFSIADFIVLLFFILMVFSKRWI